MAFVSQQADSPCCCVLMMMWWLCKHKKRVWSDMRTNVLTKTRCHWTTLNTRSTYIVHVPYVYFVFLAVPSGWHIISAGCESGIRTSVGMHGIKSLILFICNFNTRKWYESYAVYRWQDLESQTFSFHVSWFKCTSVRYDQGFHNSPPFLIFLFWIPFVRKLLIA